MCRRTTCRSWRYRPWARPGTTITTPFPGSARHGLYPGQIDLGYVFILGLGRLGLAWNINTPATLPPRQGIIPLRPSAATAEELVPLHRRFDRLKKAWL